MTVPFLDVSLLATLPYLTYLPTSTLLPYFYLAYYPISRLSRPTWYIHTDLHTLPPMHSSISRLSSGATLPARARLHKSPPDPLPIPPSPPNPPPMHTPQPTNHSLHTKVSQRPHP